MDIAAVRYHDISCGHRVHNHESKCALLHGHNYRVTFHCKAPALDDVGRIIDFSVIKERLCMWLEENWDHKFIAWVEDPIMKAIYNAQAPASPERLALAHSLVWVGFNPTAENMADYLLTKVGPIQLIGTGVTLTRVIVEETRKCSVEASL